MFNWQRSEMSSKNNLSKFCTILGLVSLIHTAYSATQHRAHFRFIEGTLENLPGDIIVQAILSLFLTMWGVTVAASDFKEISALNELEKKSCNILENKPSFVTFSHRGKVFSSVYSEENL